MNQQEQKYCNVCREKIQYDAKFCNKCGSQQIKKEINPKSMEGNFLKEKSIEDISLKKSKSNFKSILVFLSSIFLVSIIAYFYTQNVESSKIKLSNSHDSITVDSVNNHVIMKSGNQGSASDTTSIITESINSDNIPQDLLSSDKPNLEYTQNGIQIVVDTYNENDREGEYIRMKFSNKEIILKLVKESASKYKRIYSNEVYTVTVIVDSFGECQGEMSQALSGKLLIKSKSGTNTVKFDGVDALFSSKECQELVGNG